MKVRSFGGYTFGFSDEQPPPFYKVSTGVERVKTYHVVLYESKERMISARSDSTSSSFELSLPNKVKQCEEPRKKQVVLTVTSIRAQCEWMCVIVRLFITVELGSYFV